MIPVKKVSEMSETEAIKLLLKNMLPDLGKEVMGAIDAGDFAHAIAIMEIHSDAATKQDLKNLEAATKKDLEIAFESFMAKLEIKFASINARFVVLTTLGSLMFVTICLPYLQKLFVR